MLRYLAISLAIVALAAGCKVRPDGTVVLDEIPTGKPGTVYVWHPDGGYVDTEYGYDAETGVRAQ